MLKIAEDVVMIAVDCSDRSAEAELKQKYGVSGLPTIVFTSPEGEVVGHLGDRSPEGVAKQLAQLVAEHGRKIPWAESYESGLATAKEEGKPVFLFFTDEEDDDSVAMEELLGSPDLKELREKFVLVRHLVEKKCEFCKVAHVTRAPVVKILDPNLEDPIAADVYDFRKKKSAKDLGSALERGLKLFEKAREKAAEAAGGD